MTQIMGSLVLPERVIEGTMVLSAGKIVQIEEGYGTVDAETLDFRGRYLLPGLIEIHGHMREPGLEDKEDIPHGTRAGLAGGYTTILDMPNTNPPTTTPARLAEQIQRYTGRSYCDFAINMGVARDSIGALQQIAREQISGVKIFAAGHATALTTIPRLGELAEIFEILGQRAILALVHAENQELVDYFTQRERTAGNNSPAAWSQARNLSVVLTSVLEMISLARYFAVRLHLLHLSTPEEFAALAFGRSLGIDITGETTTVHLTFSSADYPRYGNLINIAPALRSPQDREQLWQLLRAGSIDAVVTDHAPHTLAEKQKASPWEVASGMPGLQEALALLLTQWVQRFGRETLEEGLVRIAQVTSRNIARIFGFASKGELSVGKDADIVVLDTTEPWQVSAQDLFTKNRWSVYEGWECIGRPVATILRGALVYRDAEIVGEPQGRWLHAR